MFEQSVDIIKTKKRPWTFALATSVELGLLAVMLLVPLVYIAPVRLPPPPSAMAAYWPHVELLKVEPGHTRAARPNLFARPQLNAIVFRAPVRIPTRVAEINDLGAPVMELEQGNVGDSGGVPGGMIASVLGSVPPVESKSPEQPRSPKGPISVGGSVQAAKLTIQILPKYPEVAKQARQSGIVEVVAVIGADGRIRQIRSVDGPILLRAAAVEAIKHWVYRPTLLNGRPVEVIAPISVHFTLNN